MHLLMDFCMDPTSLPHIYRHKWMHNDTDGTTNEWLERWRGLVTAARDGGADLANKRFDVLGCRVVCAYTRNQ